MQNPVGYATTEGFATMPVLSSFVETCPSTLTLNQPHFGISLVMTDAFQTRVRGPLLEKYNFVARLYAKQDEPCWIADDDSPNAIYETETGEAKFNSIALQGKNGTDCSLLLVTRSNTTNNVPLLGCYVEMNDCPPNYEVLVGIAEDTCAYGKSSFLLLSL